MANDPKGIIQTDEKTGEWKIDAAAFLPDPAGHLKIDSVEYPIFSFLDIPVEDSLRVVKLADDINATSSYDERMARSIEQIIMLNRGPDIRRDWSMLTKDILMRLAPRQIIALTVMATSIAQVPLKAAAGEPDSPSSALASAASTAGATQS